MATAKTFDLNAYRAESRTSSGVPPAVEDKTTLAQIARSLLANNDNEEAANGRVSKSE